MQSYLAAVLVLWVTVSGVMAQSQPFPTRADTGKLSAYLIKPTEGLDGVPSGWTKLSTLSYGNCAIADEALFNSDATAALLITRSYPLVKSDYIVSVCVRGSAQARLVGSPTWIDINVQPSNSYRWVELGTVTAASEVAVEIIPISGKQFYFGGILAEGDMLPVIPVSKVLQKIQQGGPATVVLLGDSVTENANGKGGGASSFDKGNPGLMKAFLENVSGKPVDYITHREPPNWPTITSTYQRIRNEDPAAWPELDQIPATRIDDKKYIDARQKLDMTKSLHLINLGKGGATATYSWSRMPDTIFDNDYRYNVKAMAAKGLTPFTLRYGMGYYKPDMVIVNFGTNDNNSANPKWTVDDFMFYTRCATTNIQQRYGAAVILSTPHKWTLGVHLKHHWQPLLVDRLRDFCHRSGIALADVYKQYPIGDDDGIHPGNAGHGHIADAYIAAIKGDQQSPVSKAVLTAADFKDNGDGTLTISKSGLMMFTDPDALGEVASSDEAEQLIAKLNADTKAGHNDWRIATREEAQVIVDQSRRPAVVEGAPFQHLAGFYYLKTDKGTWGIDLTIGIAHSLGSRGDAKIGHTLPVRVIR